MRIYLSQPFAGSSNFSSILSKFNQYLKNLGEFPEDPLEFDITGFSDKEIIDLDLVKVESCDLIICDLSTPNLGGGVWGELYHAYRNKIPIIVICPDNAWSSPWIRYHSSYHFKSGDPLTVEELYETCLQLLK